MVNHNAPIRVDNIALCISVEGSNIQRIHNIPVFIGNGNCIIFKSLVASLRLRAGKKKHLGASGEGGIHNHIRSLLNAVLQTVPQSEVAGFPAYHLIIPVGGQKIKMQKACVRLRFLDIISDFLFIRGGLQIRTPHMQVSQVLICQLPEHIIGLMGNFPQVGNTFIINRSRYKLKILENRQNDDKEKHPKGDNLQPLLRGTVLSACCMIFNIHSSYLRVMYFSGAARTAFPSETYSFQVVFTKALSCSNVMPASAG